MGITASGRYVWWLSPVPPVPASRDAPYLLPGYCDLMDALGTGAGASDRVVGRDPPDQARLGQLAEEQAALRRVATLVARAAPPEGGVGAGPPGGGRRR